MKRYPLYLIILSFFILGTFGCKDDSEKIDASDYSTVLAEVTNKVIVATYDDLDAQASALLVSIRNLESVISQENLNAAREAWVTARVPWERSEGFLFGPVDTKGIDPSLDSWPVNKVDLDKILNSSDALTTEFVSALEGTSKGFHTIEYLLWGQDGKKTAQELTIREVEYLVSTTEVLANDAHTLAISWGATGKNFAANLINAGESGSIYISQKAALEELANGLKVIADEVGNGKINDPLEQEDYTLEESQFSDNSKTDFSNNIVSIQNVYQGINGKGLSSIVSAKDKELDELIKKQIQEAIDAILAIPGTFTEAISASSPTRADAENAQAKVRTLQATIQEKLIPLIAGL